MDTPPAVALDVDATIAGACRGAGGRSTSSGSGLVRVAELALSLTGADAVAVDVAASGRDVSVVARAGAARRSWRHAVAFEATAATLVVRFELSGNSPVELTVSQKDELEHLGQLAADVVELQRAAHELRQSNDDLEAFAGRVAHDLRSPLSALTAFIGLARTSIAETDAESARMLLDGAREAATRMQAMLDDLLGLSRVGGRPRITTVDLEALVAQVVQDLRGDLLEGQVTVTMSSLPTVATDRVLIRSVVQNLLANAIRYAVPGRPARISIGGAVDAGCWWLSVADNGRGVPEAERHSIFNPFVRGSNAADRPGTGIGLATCVRAIEALSGTIDVGGRQHEGAVFTLRLPQGA